MLPPPPPPPKTPRTKVFCLHDLACWRDERLPCGIRAPTELIDRKLCSKTVRKDQAKEDTGRSSKKRERERKKIAVKRKRKKSDGDGGL